jgi:High potential iron-sulfur protein
MSKSISRRDALKNLTLFAGVMVASHAGHRAEAADALPHVTSTDPMAVSLSYFEDSSKVDVKKFPTYATGQRCNTCLQFKGQSADAFGPCTLFPGKVVSSEGWCKVYVKKA